jgi:hypothetical protein
MQDFTANPFQLLARREVAPPLACFPVIVNRLTDLPRKLALVLDPSHAHPRGAGVDLAQRRCGPSSADRPVVLAQELADGLGIAVDLRGGEDLLELGTDRPAQEFQHLVDAPSAAISIVGWAISDSVDRGRRSSDRVAGTWS